MFKTAPRYLSGVSVFYGDDITKRTTDGEIAFIIGQAKKGTRLPIQLRSVEHAVPIYGVDSPLMKALHEYWDGYIDSPRAQNIRLVTMRVGGIPARLETSYGLILETIDAYDGIENDLYVYVDNSTATRANVKVWDANLAIVYDSLNGVDANYVKVLSKPNGKGGPSALYGVDIDNDPTAKPVSLAEFLKLDYKDVTGTSTTIGEGGLPGQLVVTSSSLAGKTVPVTKISVSGLTQETYGLVPNSGYIRLEAKKDAVKLVGVYKYTRKSTVSQVEPIDYSVAELSLVTPISDDAWVVVDGDITNITWVVSTLVNGDSQLNIGQRAKYELFRNALLEIEQFTPDYIVPGGILFDEVDKYEKAYAASTLVVADIVDPSETNTTLSVDAAATWPASGTVNVDGGITYIKNTIEYPFVDQLNYYDKLTPDVNNDGIIDSYNLKIEIPTFKVNTTAVAGDGNLILKVDDTVGATTGLQKLRNQGYVLTSDGNYLRYINVTVIGTTATLELDPADKILAGMVSGGALDLNQIITKVIGPVTSYTYAAETQWVNPNFRRELGIGYVKETDIGGSFEFAWSEEPAPGYGLAHFGYLIANFCNSAAIGYNTPIAAMNTSLPVSTERADVVAWIGNYPKYKFVAGNGTVIEAIASNGTGLLGNPVLAGSVDYNRAYMNNKVDGVYVDPAYGLLLTDEEYIDGHEIKDTFFKVIDLGKFIITGAGLLTFNNRASQVPYLDTCGIYSLGLLSGKGKDQGISFSQVGTSSNVSVGVVVHRKYYNDLANLGYIVVTREKGLGWVINNGNSVARNDSGYLLISTTRIVKEVIEGKRAALAGFIGKALNRYSYEAAKTRIADGFRKDVQNGLLNGYTFDLQIEDAGQAIGKLYLKCSINPPFELTQVDIDTVIDRSVTSVTG